MNGPRFLLRLLPAELRAAYGGEVHAAFRARLAEERARGRFAALRYAFAALLDLVRTASRSRWQGRGPEPPRRRRPALGNLVADLRFAVRSLARERAFTAAAVLTLAFGIGITTVVVSLVDAALLRSASPFEDPSSLVAVYSFREDLQRHSSVSYPDYLDLEASAAFAGLAVTNRAPVNIGDGETARRISVELVSPQYFEMLGVGAAIGRPLSSEDADLPRVLISHRLWQQRFGAAADVLGAPVRLNGNTYTIVGVAPRRFRGTRIDGSADVWAPVGRIGDFLSFGGAPLDGTGAGILDYRGYMTFELIGRLAPGVGIEDAQRRVGEIATSIRERFEGYDIAFRVTPHQWGAFRVTDRPEVVRYSTVLAIVSAAVLLIGCVNVANLLLARAVERRPELAIRTALGADRRRLFGQQLTESVVLALAGGGLGLALAAACLPLLAQLRLPAGIAVDLRLDPRIALLSFGVTATAVIVFGVAPALRASRGDLAASTRRSASLGRGGRSVLVAAQLSLAVALVFGAALLTRTWLGLNAVDAGFDRGDILVAGVDPGLAGHDESSGIAYFGALLERLEGISAVRAAATASEVPLEGPFGAGPLFIDVTGAEMQTGIGQSIVAPSYFNVLGIDVVAGRGFSRDDTAASRPVLIVNESMAEHYWPGEDALGRTLRTTPDGTAAVVVGVVADVRHQSLRQPPGPHVYWPQLQVYNWLKGSPLRVVLIAVDGDPAAALPSIRAAASAVDPRVPLFDVSDLETRIADSLVVERQSAALLVAFAAAGFALAGVGLFGSLSYMVSRRRLELGIRAALGASPRGLFADVVRHGIAVTAAGGVGGLALALPGARFVDSWLYGVSPLDPTTIATMALVLAAVSLAATLPVAARAGATDPLRVMRDD